MIKKCLQCNKELTYQKKFCSRQCAQDSGVSVNTGRTRFKKGIIPWNKGKQVLKTKGENHWNWKGGVSFEKYPEKFYLIKPKIRERDNHICQMCNKYTRGIKLDVHHIDYNKQNNKENNLISLCHKCNMKCNIKREYWTWQLQVFMNLFNNTNHELNMIYNNKMEVKQK